MTKQLMTRTEHLEQVITFCGIDLVTDLHPLGTDTQSMGVWWGWRASCPACVTASQHLWRPAMERLYAMALRAEPVDLFGDQLGGFFTGKDRHIIDQWKGQFALCCEVDGIRMCTMQKGHGGKHIDGWRAKHAEWEAK